MSDNVKDIPIVLVDMAGFSKLKTIPEQRAILKRLDTISATILQKFSGFIDPHDAFKWHDTGD
ncbi:MAG: hypothetical protein HQL94_09350, partial [Magnetococcales bacterium]|nr:hypothetical protein [Magnetococcales bacterium]